MVTALHRIIGLVGVSLLAPLAVHATQTNLNGLLQNSPFGSTAGNKIENRPTPLEFRGVMAEGETYYFSIYAQSDSRSEWLEQDERSAKNYVIKSYDAAKQELTLEYQGQALTLALSSSRNSTVAQRSSPQASLQTPTTNPTTVQPARPENDAARLGKIAEEIKRRRALRQKAIAGN